jgi:hypothetical protein
MSELKDRLLKQLETDYSEDARNCLKIYEAIKELNEGSIPSDQWMVLSRVQYLGTHIDPMRVYSPSKIDYVFLKGLERDGEMKTLLITETEARIIYPNTSGEFKKKLEDTFGIERLTLSFQELVKTYEDACEITGSVPDIECDDRSELARLKLIQIYKASNILNDNWKLTPLGTQCAFYPSFMWKKDRLVCNDICHTLYSVSCDPKLCCGKREDAFYIGTRFIDLYRDYLLLE